MAVLSRQPEVVHVAQTLVELRDPNDRSDQARLSLDGRDRKFAAAPSSGHSACPQQACL
jgi:hypothetical protein